eukprot:CAMPEP_0198218544 /NCGR_PEP_ID=MMETSP1445-20131203/69881_1 /TAXON_ID=36898 /ORGANISM="Pyramimonas sp., Strain CCMP2087" /LENGTH=77 /DNA_ID=CAMNT_0043895625 /DNA_START=116 /DNA_END=345 /DNA_ORIENTATION=+
MDEKENTAIDVNAVASASALDTFKTKFEEFGRRTSNTRQLLAPNSKIPLPPSRSQAIKEEGDEEEDDDGFESADAAP